MAKTKDWKEIIKERDDLYNSKVSEITSTLTTVLFELKVSPYNFHKVEANLIENPDNLIWKVTIGKHSKLFYPQDFQLVHQASGENTETLEERIKEAILEKFTFEFK